MNVGSLFSGYGGLDLGVNAVLGSETVWHVEWESAPSAILAHHHGVPNYGDVTSVKWNAVEPIDVLIGGFPCQDVSHAGKRLGLRPGTRSGLWSHMAYAIDKLRPSLVVAENVRGLLNAEAASDLEPCSWCVGDDPRGALRALGAVLGDLADLGYDAQWHGVRAADVGAPHARFRVFVFAWPAGATSVEDRVGDGDVVRDGWGEGRQREDAGTGTARDTDRATGRERWVTTSGQAAGGWARADIGRRGRAPTAEMIDLLPTATTKPPTGNGHARDLGNEVRLLPTPAVNDMGAGKTVEAWDEWTACMQTKHANGNGHGKSLAIEAQRLLPTAQHEQQWGAYEAAIRRWEMVLGRVAPNPTGPGKNGQPRLSPVFVEFMMGLPAGHVTGVPGISRNDQLKALGNGVVPQQAAAALHLFLTTRTTEDDLP